MISAAASFRIIQRSHVNIYASAKRVPGSTCQASNHMLVHLAALGHTADHSSRSTSRRLGYRAEPREPLAPSRTGTASLHADLLVLSTDRNNAGACGMHEHDPLA